jgi:hypothetical protein
LCNQKQDQGDTRDLGMVNFSTVEPGLPAVSVYSFSLRASRGPLDAVASYRDGWEENVPLITTQLDNSMDPATDSGSFFTFSAENVALLAFKPSADDNPEHYTLRLQEIAGKPTDTNISTTWKVTAAAIVSMTEDEELATATAQPLTVQLKPHETLTVRLTIPHPHKERSTRWREWLIDRNDATSPGAAEFKTRMSELFPNGFDPQFRTFSQFDAILKHVYSH